MGNIDPIDVAAVGVAVGNIDVVSDRIAVVESGVVPVDTNLLVTEVISLDVDEANPVHVVPTLLNRNSCSACNMHAY